MKFNAINNNQSNPHFISLKDGQSITGILRGDPIDYKEKFKGEGKPQFKFQINMIINANGSLEAKILRGGWKLYKQISDMANAGWKLEETFVKISRTGSTQNDTVYSATPSPSKPDSSTLAKVDAVKLHDLVDPTIPAVDNQEEQHSEDIPF